MTVGRPPRHFARRSPTVCVKVFMTEERRFSRPCPVFPAFAEEALLLKDELAIGKSSLARSAPTADTCDRPSHPNPCLRAAASRIAGIAGPNRDIAGPPQR